MTNNYDKIRKINEITYELICVKHSLDTIMSKAPTDFDVCIYGSAIQIFDLTDKVIAKKIYDLIVQHYKEKLEILQKQLETLNKR